jgi:hypothetical protein
MLIAAVTQAEKVFVAFSSATIVSVIGQSQEAKFETKF